MKMQQLKQNRKFYLLRPKKNQLFYPTSIQKICNQYLFLIKNNGKKPIRNKPNIIVFQIIVITQCINSNNNRPEKILFGAQNINKLYIQSYQNKFKNILLPQKFAFERLFSCQSSRKYQSIKVDSQYEVRIKQKIQFVEDILHQIQCNKLIIYLKKQLIDMYHQIIKQNIYYLKNNSVYQQHTKQQSMYKVDQKWCMITYNSHNQHNLCFTQTLYIIY
eukprot:TRINITY_DN6175_c0_g1_i4.p1 TRINITY_DN6175_c0_g1~~TRINITY_DN6175_c0_g1_i4.p1  ORF type:complete len:218 (+),score=-28.28 TRINITY_DN6175_c0_g1_i4:246-899(+)